MTQLYDMSKQEWRKGSFSRGSSWRSTDIYQCKACHTKTNEWVMGGWPGTGPRLLCPGDRYKEHDELVEAYEKYAELDEKVRYYKESLPETSNQEKARQFLDNLEAEKELLEAKLKRLRKLFDGKTDNIVLGAGEFAEVLDFFPYTRVGGQKESIEPVLDYQI